MSEYDEQGQLCEECKHPSRAGHSNECSKKNTTEQKAPEQKLGGLTDQEKATLVAKETAKVFKEVLDPKAAIKKVKDFFRK